MDTWSVGEVAAALGVTAPTVLRAAERLGLRPGRTAGGHRRFDRSTVVSRLIPELGVVPVVAGLSRQAVQVLAGLSRHPLGLHSARAVARAGRVSATTASRLLPELVAGGYVVSESRRLAAGRAVDVTVHRIDRSSSAWQRVAPVVGRVVLPAPRPRRAERRVPDRLGHLFWNADLRLVDLDRDAAYVAGRLLLSDDPRGIAWAVSNLSTEAIAAAGRLRHADPRQRALAANVAASR